MELNAAGREAATGAFTDRIGSNPTTGELLAALHFALVAYETARGAGSGKLPALPAPAADGNYTVPQVVQIQKDAFEAASQSHVAPPFAAPASQHEAIVGAVARGWCAPANANKIMDEELAYAIVAEVEKLLASGGREGRQAKPDSPS